MKKTIPLFIALLAFGSLKSFAGNEPEANKAQFQFTALDMTQNSWDYALLHYNINDLNTGENIEIPSFLINYEVKDKSGALVSKGSGLYVNVMDSKLGSEEDFTIAISTMINGQKVTQSICKKASPKKFAMKVNASEGLESGVLAYTFSRPKFNHPEKDENVQIGVAEVALNVSLNNTNYKIDAGTNHAELPAQAGYQNLQKEIQQLEKGGKTAAMSIKPTLTFKGEVYTDNQSYYEVTAKGITEVSTLDAVASK